MSETKQEIPHDEKRNNRIFGVLLLLTQTVLIFMFAFFIAYAKNRTIADDYLIIAALFLLALCGFGLITGYVNSVTTVSLTHVIIIFALSLQLYFPFRGFWEIIGLSGTLWQTRNDDDVLPVSVTNYLNDRKVSQMLQSSPLTDYIACFISLIVSYSAVIGRVGNLQVYFLTVVGTFMYEFNAMIFWRIFITDCGFGMRIFLFGGFFGLFAGLILARRQTTFAHPRFASQYYHQTLQLLGSILIWCLLPVLSWSDLWHNTSLGTDSYALHTASLNIWFALCGSALGSACFCIGLYKKLNIHTLIFSSFTGGIAYLSSSDLIFNPGAAIGIGFLASVLSAAFVTLFKQRQNKNGVRDTNGVVGSYLVPGFISGLLSAIFHANILTNIYMTKYQKNSDINRTFYEQGGIQIAGIGIAIGCGIFSGLVSGLLMKIVNKRQSRHQFSSVDIVAEEPVRVQQDVPQ